MKAYVYPADVFGCGHYRLKWPAQAVAANSDLEVEIIEVNEDRQIGCTLNRDGSVRDVMFPPDADIIVLQRPTHKYLAQSIPILRSKGIAVIVDMDDDLRTIHPTNPAFMALHPRNPTVHSWQNSTEACRHASLVTVSTPALLRRYGSHGRARVLTNKVPARYLDIPHTDSDVVGWGGSVHSHPNDLQTVGNSFVKLVNGGMEFVIVGSGDDVARVMQLHANPDSTGVVEFDDWPAEISKLGIGIAPLADTVFNEAKSWLKPLEYASVGVPWVASARTEYAKLAKMGGGIVVNKPREWEGTLKRLLREPSLREELSNLGRETARTLTYEGCAGEWIDAWEYAVQVERGETLVGARHD